VNLVCTFQNVETATCSLCTPTPRAPQNDPFWHPLGAILATFRPITAPHEVRGWHPPGYHLPCPKLLTFLNALWRYDTLLVGPNTSHANIVPFGPSKRVFLSTPFWGSSLAVLFWEPFGAPNYPNRQHIITLSGIQALATFWHKRCKAKSPPKTPNDLNNVTG